VEVRGKTTKLGLTFPNDATVLRKEIHDKIVAENQAAQGSFGADDFGGISLDLNIGNDPKTND
jgi:carbon storage regulator